MQSLFDSIKADEGFSTSAYKDRDGKSVGYGFYLSDSSAFPTFQKATGLGEKEFNAIANGEMEVTETIADQLLKAKVEDATAFVPKYIKTLDQMSPAQQEAIYNFAYNVGESTFSDFKNTIAQANSGNWQGVADGLRNSAWYSQVGNRGERIAGTFDGGGSDTAPSIPSSTDTAQTRAALTDITGAPSAPNSISYADQRVAADVASRDRPDFLDAGNLSTAIGLGFDTQNMVANFLDQTAEERDIDPNFTLSDELVQSYAKGLTEDQQEYVFQGQSERAIAARYARTQKQLKQQEQLGKMGVPLAVLGTLTGAIVDLPTAMAFVPLLGSAANISRTSRLSNAIANAFASGSAAAALEYKARDYKPLATMDDVYIAGLGAAGFGLVGGFIKNPSRLLIDDLEDAGRYFGNAYKRATQLEFETYGLKPTDRFFELEVDAEPRPRFTPDIGEPVEPTPKFEDAPPAPPKQAETPPANPLEPQVPTPKEPEADAPVPPKEASAPSAPTKKTIPELADDHEPTFKEYVEQTGSRPNDPKFNAGLFQALELPTTLTKPSQILDYVAKWSKQPQLKLLAERLKKAAGRDIDKMDFRWAKTGEVTYKGGDPLEKNVGGFVRTGIVNGFEEQLFVLNKSTAFGRSEVTAIHELVHAVTTRQHRYYSEGHGTFYKDIYGIELNPKVAAGVKELDDLYKEVEPIIRNMLATEGQAAMGHFSKYGIMNAREFMSVGLTDPDFQKLLRSIPVSKGKSVWSKFMEGIAKILGLKKGEHNALSELYRTTDKLMTSKPFNKTSKDASQFTVSNQLTQAEVKQIVSKSAVEPDSVFGVGLGLEDSLGGAKVPASVRSLAQKLFGTTKGYKNKAVVQRSAWDVRNMLRARFGTETKRVAETEYQKWLKVNKVPFKDRYDARAKFQREMYEFTLGITDNVSPEAQRAATAYIKGMEGIVDHINNPALHRGGQAKGLTQRVIGVDPDTGEEILSPILEKNGRYIPRQIDLKKFHEIASEFGNDFLYDFFEQSFRRANPDLPEEWASKIGRWYVNTLRDARLNQKEDFFQQGLDGIDLDYLKETMKGGGLDDALIDDIMEKFYGVTRGETLPTNNRNLKKRTLLDETFSVTTDGGREITFADLFRTDVMGLFDNYTNRMAGSVSLADGLGIYNLGDERKAIMEATKQDFGSPMREVEKYRTQLQMSFDSIMGRPLEQTTTGKKFMQMFRDFNVMTKMSMAVLNQVQEMSQIIGTLGLKTTLAAIPELRKIRRSIKDGTLDNEFLNDLERLTGGAGQDMINNINWAPDTYFEDTFGGTKAAKFGDASARVLKRGASAVLNGTGMTGLMAQQKRVLAVALINHFVDAANGTKKLAYNKDRLAWMGLDEADTTALMGNLQKYAQKNQKGKVGKVDFNKWQAEDPDNFSKFMIAFQRESHRTVQENDLASMIPLMGTTLGQTFFQFMNFTFQAWNKSLMFGANYRDIQTMQTLMWGTTFSTLVYAGRTYANGQGMSREEQKKYYDENLSLEKTVIRGLGRLPQASILPSVFDTFSPEPVFSGMRTTTDGSSLLANPTTDLVGKAFNFSRKLAKSTSDDYELSEADVRSAMKMLPMSNFLGVSQLINHVASGFPENGNTE